MIIAVFDLDGTLYTGHIGQGIADHHKTHRTKRFWLYLYLASHYPLWFMQKARLVSDETGRSIWARDMGWLFRGWTPEKAHAASQWITEQYVVPRLRPQLMRRVEDHQRSGHHLLLLSGTPLPLLTAIGQELGIEHVVGTPLRLRNGHYTGKSEPPVCQGANKVLRLEEHLTAVDEVQWSQSWAYADSYSDLPVLERVGHPVAVCPDPALAAHAKERDWEIIMAEEGLS